jgi:hypothetical protein
VEATPEEVGLVAEWVAAYNACNFSAWYRTRYVAKPTPISIVVLVQNRLFPWSHLRHANSPIIRRVYNRWLTLLRNASADEGAYRKFLAKHAGFFLQSRGSFLSISELRLGAEYRVDLVRTADRGSYGFEYELIELESPNSPLFTRAGIPSKRLNTALQQIRDWRRWIDQYREEAKRLFPSKMFTLFDRESFNYTILIGRRSTNKLTLDRRNQLSVENDVQIRSYDYLTDLFKQCLYTDDVILCSSEADRLAPRERNELASPFAEAMSDGEWRHFREQQPDICHMYANNAQLILSLRRYNPLLREFDSLTANVSDEEIRERFFDVRMRQVAKSVRTATSLPKP